MLIFLIILILLFGAELIYFKIADKFNIIDKPNMRSSHTKITLRGGGIIFLIAAWLYCAFFGFNFPYFMLGLTLVSIVSFVDDVHSLGKRYRLIVQFVSFALMFVDLCIVSPENLLLILFLLVFCVGVVNFYNFMDGINGITGGYSLSVLASLLISIYYYDYALELSDFVIVMIISLLVFNFFNFRKKAKCFAGDVGSVGIAFAVIFVLFKVIAASQDITYIVFLSVYMVDACLTILHRIMLHENLGEAHRKHAYQLMANELKINHVLVSSIYLLLQFAINIGFLFLPVNHWIYVITVFVLLSLVYVIFMRKYYHLHVEYLKSKEISQ